MNIKRQQRQHQRPFAHLNYLKLLLLLLLLLTSNAAT